MTLLQCAAKWTESHAGLGGWVGAAGSLIGAIGALLAIWATWIIARREYNRAIKQEMDKRRGEIDLILRIITAFEMQIHQYQASNENDPKLFSFYDAHSKDPEWQSMADLASLPVTNWPALEIYMEFKRYWQISIEFTKKGGGHFYAGHMYAGNMGDKRRVARQESLVKLSKLLQCARSRC
jgi:hypothetical protein